MTVLRLLLDLGWNCPACRVSTVDSLATASCMYEAEVLLTLLKYHEGRRHAEAARDKAFSLRENRPGRRWGMIILVQN